MFGYKIIIEKIWSNNILWPKADIIKSKLNGKYFPSLPTNKFKRFTYRLKISIVKKRNIYC